MDTPLSSAVGQHVRAKRNRTATPEDDADHTLQSAVNLLVNDDQLPHHLKAVLGHVLDKLTKLDVLVERNRELEIQLKAEIAEKNRLLDEIRILKNSRVNDSRPSSPHIVERNAVQEEFHCCEEKERLRSIVIAGVDECNDLVVSNRIAYDFNCIKHILSFLSIECAPVTFYRMGRPKHVGSRRLLKVVLPNTFFRNEVLSRAPRLKQFPVRGVYIRPSLPKTELARLRTLRSQKLSSSSNGMQVSSATPSNVVTSTHVPSANNASPIVSATNVNTNSGNN